MISEESSTVCSCFYRYFLVSFIFCCLLKLPYVARGTFVDIFTVKIYPIKLLIGYPLNVLLSIEEGKHIRGAVNQSETLIHVFICLPYPYIWPLFKGQLIKGFQYMHSLFILIIHYSYPGKGSLNKHILGIT